MLFPLISRELRVFYAVEPRVTLGITGLKKRYLFQIRVHSIVRGELPHRNPNELHMEILILL